MNFETIPITADTTVDNVAAPAFGPIMLSLPEGEARCHDAVSFTMITADHAIDGQFIVVIAVANFEGRHLGVLTPMRPAEARSFAASLIRGADQIDPLAPAGEPA